MVVYILNSLAVVRFFICAKIRYKANMGSGESNLTVNNSKERIEDISSGCVRSFLLL